MAIRIVYDIFLIILDNWGCWKYFMIIRVFTTDTRTSHGIHFGRQELSKIKFIQIFQLEIESWDDLGWDDWDG